MNSKSSNAIKYQGLLLVAFMFAAVVSVPALAQINDYRFYIYLPDFNIGYCQKLLVGGVLAFFKDSYTKEWLYGFMRIVVAAVSLIFALFLGKWVSRSPEELRMPYLVIALFFATSPYAFTIFSSLIGLHDIYWYFFILIALMCVKNKVLMWLVPLLSVLCVANHIAYLIILFPVLLIILLHCVVHAEKKGAYLALLIAVLLLTGGATVYVLFFERQTIKMTMLEMLSYTKSKINTKIDSLGFEYFLYGYSEGSTPEAPPAEGYYYGNSIIAIVKTLMTIMKENVMPFRIYKCFLAVLPVLVSSVYIWSAAIKKAKKAIERLIYVLCILTVLCLPVFWILSTDTKRWAAMYCVSQLLLLVWMLGERDENVCAAFNKFVCIVKKYPLIAAGAVCLSYMIP